jgi:protein KRI1
MNILSDSEEDINDLQINESYAKRFEHNKRRDELQQLKEKYGEGEKEESSSSEDELEDDDGELITPQVDAQIMKTIKLIQEKNPIIYDKNTKLIDDDLIEEARKNFESKTTEKGISLKEYQANMLLNPEGEKVKTFSEEQDEVKHDFKAAVGEIEEDEEDLFTVRKEEAEEDYSKFILNEMYKDEPDNKEWDKLKQKLEPDQQFLMNYVLNKGWKDKDAGKVPTYTQLTEHALHDSTDEEDEERMEEFEYKHNFRFEEEGSQFIVTHSRNVPGTIRRKDDKRTIQRQSASERKQELKKQKAEELKRLKNLKKQELQEKLKQIQDMAGGDLIGFGEIDLEEEFDPADYDKKMSSAFSEDYYAQVVRIGLN